ncbi:unnamed protein product [Dibothriocephalus latus]|uniref:Uncharacterized protein n=1 Tax=Dibothriocephalus latus TaxID=60516 RepID=A0A3P7MZC2_DIBLA|nr:unnamed protein product [Dibothriocephalus latus]
MGCHDGTKKNDPAEGVDGCADECARQPKVILFPVIVSASDSSVLETAYLQVNHLADEPNLSLRFLTKPNYHSTLLFSDMEMDSDEKPQFFNEVMAKEPTFVFFKQDITGIR